jgi:hypothetical protein
MRIRTAPPFVGRARAPGSARWGRAPAIAYAPRTESGKASSVLAWCRRVCGRLCEGPGVVLGVSSLCRYSGQSRWTGLPRPRQVCGRFDQHHFPGKSRLDGSTHRPESATCFCDGDCSRRRQKCKRYSKINVLQGTLYPTIVMSITMTVRQRFNLPQYTRVGVPLIAQSHLWPGVMSIICIDAAGTSQRAPCFRVSVHGWPPTDAQSGSAEGEVVRLHARAKAQVYLTSLQCIS